MSSIDHRHMTKADKEAIKAVNDAVQRLAKVLLNGGVEGHQLIGGFLFFLCITSEATIEVVNEMEKRTAEAGTSVPVHELAELHASLAYHKQKLDAVVPWVEGMVAKFMLDTYGYNPGYSFKRGEYEEAGSDERPADCPTCGAPLPWCKCAEAQEDPPKN